MFIEDRLPGKLLGGEHVTLARLLAADDTGARREDDSGFATRRAPLRIRRRQTEEEVALVLVYENGFL
jgi:hypothetical protein